MKKAFVILVTLLFVVLASAFAQTANDTIAVKKNKYYYHGMQIESVRQIKSLVANDELALKEVKKAGVVGGFAYVLGYLGGSFVGYELGSALFGQFNPYIFAGGAALAGIGIGLGALADSHLKKGVTIYNSNLGASSDGSSVKLDFGLTPGGVGLTLSF